jgi:hypothetical protein
LHQALVLPEGPPYGIKVVGKIGPGQQALCGTFVLYRVWNLSWLGEVNLLPFPLRELTAPQAESA